MSCVNCYLSNISEIPDPDLLCSYKSYKNVEKKHWSEPGPIGFSLAEEWHVGQMGKGVEQGDKVWLS